MEDLRMTDQAVGAIMMALQKSLLEQSDIVPVLKGLKFSPSEIGLVVLNPPIVKFTDEVEDKMQESAQQSFEFDVVAKQSE